MAPMAMSNPTLVTVAPTPLPKLSRVLEAPRRGDQPEHRGAEDEREERVHLDDGDEHDDGRDAEQRGEDELGGPGGGSVCGDERNHDHLPEGHHGRRPLR